MFKFDIHLNLEQFPTSRNSDTKIYSSVDDLAEFISKTVSFKLKNSNYKLNF